MTRVLPSSGNDCAMETGLGSLAKGEPERAAADYGVAPPAT